MELLAPDRTLRPPVLEPGVLDDTVNLLEGARQEEEAERQHGAAG